jgi:predicted ATP-binding protein involved in virulence
MRIKKITVKKLFGIFDHEIPLNMDDRITIIHAPNGFGKTTILKMLHDLFNGNYGFFFLVPFERFEVDFDDKTIVRVYENLDNKSYNVGNLSNTSDKPEKRKSQQDNKKQFSNMVIELVSKEHPRTMSFPIPEEIIEPDDTTSEYIRTLSRLLEKSSFSDVPVSKNKEFKIPDWWSEFQKKTSIWFIQTQRLQNIKSNSVPTVEEYAKDLKNRIQQKLAEFATLSQSLDSTFPSRLVKQMGQNHSNLTNEQITEEFNKLEKKRSELMEVGLLDKSKDEAFSLPETTSEQTKEVLSVYVQDVKEKLKIFDEIANKIKLFKNIITKRFQYKDIIISKETGFHFVSSDGNPLPLNALSSGEQNELVMFYQLLFKTKPDSVILIDEPEISLHVAWQRDFLEEISEIVKIAELDIILATHSPSIINDRWDLTVRLKEPDRK